MAAPVASRLRDALTDYLAAVVAVLTDPPERRYVSPGPPAPICDLIAVYASPLRVLSLDQPSELPAPRSQPRMRLVPLVAEVWRCVSTDANPSEATLHAEGLRHADDAWALSATLTYRLSEGLVFTTLALPQSTRSANVDLVEVLEPQGGMAGWRATVGVHL